MNKEVFKKQCRLSLLDIRVVLSPYADTEPSIDMMLCIAQDLRLIAKNIEELVDVYEKENRIK